MPNLSLLTAERIKELRGWLHNLLINIIQEEEDEVNHASILCLLTAEESRLARDKAIFDGAEPTLAEVRDRLEDVAGFLPGESSYWDALRRFIDSEEARMAEPQGADDIEDDRLYLANVVNANAWEAIGLKDRALVRDYLSRPAPPADCAVSREYMAAVDGLVGQSNYAVEAMIAFGVKDTNDCALSDFKESIAAVESARAKMKGE